MTNMERAIAVHALEQVARNNGTTVEEVRKEMRAMIAEAMQSEDSAVRDKWRFVPCSGSVPTPEELIIYTSKQVMGGGESHA